MSNMTEQSTVDQNAEPEPFPTDAEFTQLVSEMVTDEAPRVFAIVLEYGEHADAEIVAWGMALDDGAYVITTDSVNQYLLAAPENALNYLRGGPGTTPHLVWAAQKS
ncbi:hypothetical protein JOF56_001035 [Kibdelosporangium banguiense]|uniref:Immunity protein 35 n=1 Tax=Kibdelosporangium banguiense TaxID=1365924 RepID=A0ABS4T8A5_9PSEU|nr:hypothetical protein [Kibdelosporangium banguiense]MBP2320650.1 hypothetical protein [Kibdelosporangium banguiense]